MLKLWNRAKRPEPEVLAKWRRNDECWCGSGKKYKNCHMDKDRAKK